MVQFVPLNPISDCREDIRNAKHYWKVLNPADSQRQALREILWTNGIGTTSRTPRGRLDAMYIRLQRGMLIYEGCTTQELSKFCIDRRIPGVFQGNRAHKMKDNLIALLEQADESPHVGSGFMDLPPELRMRTYEWYKASLPNALESFTIPPPITQVFRESLSVFFEEKLFMCDKHPLSTRGPTSLMRCTAEFWTEAPETLLRCVKRLSIMGPIGDVGSGYAEFRIDLRGRTREQKAFFERLGTYSCNGKRKEETMVAAEDVESRLRKLCDEIAGREGMAFRREDAAAILNALRLRE